MNFAGVKSNFCRTRNLRSLKAASFPLKILNAQDVHENRITPTHEAANVKGNEFVS